MLLNYFCSVVHPVLGEPTLFSFISDDFGSSVGFGTSILLAGLIGFQAKVRVNKLYDSDWDPSVQVVTIVVANC